MKIEDTIKELRLKKSIKQQTIAEALNVDVAVISNIENGKRDLKVKELEKIANVFNMSVVDLITYPDKYILSASNQVETVEAVLQIKLSKEKKDQVFQLMFGEHCVEILNK